MFSRRARSLSTLLAVGLAASVLAAMPSTASGTPSPAGSSAAPVQAGVFRALPAFELDEDSPRLRVEPKAFAAYAVDHSSIARSLARAARGETTFSVPDPSGELVPFEVVEDSVMESKLAAAHPEIRTYAARATDGSGLSGRFDITPLGFHAFLRAPAGMSWYVDPAYDRPGETRHLSYYRAAVPAAPEAFVEQEIKHAADEAVAASSEPRTEAARAPGDPVTRRTYRMAFVTDPTYADYFNGEVLAAKATLINRVNALYNDDLAIRFVLINETPKLNLDTDAKAAEPNGPCGASPCYDASVYQGAAPAGCGDALGRNTFVLGQLVGADTFDIGHIGLGVNGGGVAYLGSVGGTLKAGGCTGLPQPTGDFYAVDYFAHEVGHQMGGPHTFNGTQHNCSPPNRNTLGGPYTSQVEPGSGSTIMAYAGICRQDNLQPHSDPYFSFSSIEDITATVADDTSTVSERQVVSFVDPDGAGPDTGFGAGDAVTLSCAGCPGTPVTITNNVAYSTPAGALDIATKIGQLTGYTPLVGDYDDEDPVFGFPAGLPSEAGFTLEWSVDGQGAGEDIPRLQATPAAGSASPFSVFVGVTYQGGPTTNEGTKSATGNAAPAATAPADKTIPIRTPFTLTGSGSDKDNQSLIYLWEQTDPGGPTGTTLSDNNKTEGPLFRVFGNHAEVTPEGTLLSPSPGLNLAGPSPSRTFPDMKQILAGTTNAKTGTCPPAPQDPPVTPPPPPPYYPTTPLPPNVRECYSEFLPTANYNSNYNGRTLTFRLTARDLFATGGGTATDDVELTINPNAGPFLVTSRASAGIPAKPGATETVRWQVAGTNTAALAQNVKISLSIDGGNSFPVVLAASTPNDGSQQITLPKVNTAQARIKVEAVDNYFFDVNDANFTIGDGRAVDTLIVKGPKKRAFVKARKATFKLASTVPGSTFRCTLDGKVKPCTDVAKFRLKSGTHVFKAAARTPNGILDSSPARRVFASPFNESVLKLASSGWTKHKDKKSYRGTYAEADDPGRVLRLAAKGIKKLALVAHTGPGFGRVAILVGDDRVKTLDLSSKKLRKRVLLKITGFAKPRSGTIRIVTLDNKVVRIDGIGVFSTRRS